MSSSLFRIREHTLPCQHIRGYPHATANEQEDVLHISIKQYTPLRNLQPKLGDVTIIGAHANGFPKELYEPLWDEMLQRADQAGFSIRSIWIADVAHQGASSVLNEGKLGNDPSWFDHPRDLLHMVNTFRSEMPRPIIGIGHSMGGNNLVNLSLLHPRLLETLVLIDPVIARFASVEGNFAPTQASAVRRDVWPSREAARAGFKRSKFYQTWDPRVLDRWVEHGLRELPTLIYPSVEPAPTPIAATGLVPTTTEPTVTPPISKQVTLTTPKHQEVFTFLRANYASPSSELATQDSDGDRLTHPDVTPTAHQQTPFYRPEPIITFHNLPHLRASVLYIFGDESPFSSAEVRADKMANTGTGVGGSGGAKEGRVKEVLMTKVGHMIPMEQVVGTAENTVAWIGPEMSRWRRNEEILMQGWDQMSKKKKTMMSERFYKEITAGAPARKPAQSKM